MKMITIQSLVHLWEVLETDNVLSVTIFKDGFLALIERKITLFEELEGV
ncbi:MAG: hypothetical protein PHG08_00940 [Bacilli bacterium]|nr:hypothetical protein [Bacilli bacterium]